MKIETKSMAMASTAPEALTDSKRIQAAQVRELCGGISDMSLWRWLADDNLNFPKPIRIARRRYWRASEVMAWLDAPERQS